jgi:hypothetical protein
MRLATRAIAFVAAGLLATASALAQEAAKPKAKAQVSKPGSKQATAKGQCVTKHGKGWAWTLDMAKFQSWEIIAQTTGNWPIATDKLVNERYTCKPDGSGYTCFAKVDVCKA